MSVCGKCDKDAKLCPMCVDICLDCCDFGLCPKCDGHLEGDEFETGYCCDCQEEPEESEESERGLKRSRE
jgi:hypothetical protein